MIGRRTIFREFVELEPREFAQLHATAVNRDTWPEEREVLSSVLKQWEALQRASNPATVAQRRPLASVGVTAPIARIVSKHLERHVTMRLQGDFSFVAPVSNAGVLGVVWLRLARAMAREGDEFECLQCRNAFTAKRVDVVFCGPTCKLRWSRAKSK